MASNTNQHALFHLNRNKIKASFHCHMKRSKYKIYAGLISKLRFGITKLRL